MSLKKQFAVTLASVGLGAALIGGGTFAWFNTTAKIEGNTFAAGTMKIGATPASAVFNVSNLKPGDWMERTFVVENEGSISVDKLLMNIDYTINDVDNNNGAEDFDENLKVYLLKSTDENIPLPQRIIVNPNNGKTLKELKAMGKLDISSWWTQNFDLRPGDSDKIYVGIEFVNKNEDQNRFQGDGVNLTFNLEGTQKAGERR
ncbi:TasA family protein [Brevibacillus sp. GCM10020057]|uniref:TasA family protein n=1 Tax=Brevibacillus sp. GCM10020057 TaxID=3317327 RepID=UPI003636BCB1